MSSINNKLINLIEIQFELFIGELNIYYKQYGSNYKMVEIFMDKHFKLRQTSGNLNMINIADKYFDTIDDLIRKIGGEE
jgi:hypothetical protein